MPFGNSPTNARLGAIRGRKPNPRAGKTSRRRLVGHYHGAPAPRCDDTASSPRADFGASGTFFRLSRPRPAPGFSSRTAPRRGECPARISCRCRRPRDGTVLRKANNCERPVASVSRETAARAPEIPAGHGPAVRPTSRGSGRFPGRLAVRRAAWFRPALSRLNSER